VLFSVKQSKSPSRVAADSVTDSTKSSLDVSCEMYVFVLSKLRTQQNYMNLMMLLVSLMKITNMELHRNYVQMKCRLHYIALH